MPLQGIKSRSQQLVLGVLFLPIVVVLHLLLFGETGLGSVGYFDPLKG